MEVKKRKVNTPVVIEYRMSANEMPESYSEIVIKIIKYIACQKQIPYPYDHLKLLATKKFNHIEGPSLSSTKRTRHFRKATEAFEVLENIFQHLTAELKDLNSGDVEEIMVILGSTPASAKETYRIQLPSSTGNCKHSKTLSCGFIRQLLKSEEFHEIISRPLNPTNMYLFVKKPAGMKSKWLLPKDQFSVPLCGSQAIFSFTVSEPQRTPHTPDNSSSSFECEPSLGPSFSIYKDDSFIRTASAGGDTSLQEPSANVHWYQAKMMFRGFKDS